MFEFNYSIVYKFVALLITMCDLNTFYLHNCSTISSIRTSRTSLNKSHQSTWHWILMTQVNSITPKLRTIGNCRTSNYTLTLKHDDDHYAEDTPYH